jgi:uncharacterized membrane protein
VNRNQWLSEQTRGWRERGIISEEQFCEIVAGYPIKPSVSPTRIVFVFAALLVGLGVVLFFASNWQELPKVLKLTIIYTAIVLAYYSGYKLYFEKASPGLGFSLIFLGNLFFGAGLWLTGQMFHILSFNSNGFLYWFLAAALLAYLMKSALFMGLAVILLSIYGVTGAVIYSDYLFYYICLVAVVFPFLYFYKTILLTAFSLASLTVVFLVMFLNIGITPWFINIILLGLALTALGQFSYRLIPEYVPILQGFGMALGFLGAVALVFSGENWFPINTDRFPFYLTLHIVLLVLAALPVLLKKAPAASSGVLIIFLPVFALQFHPGISLDVVSVVILGLFSIALIFAGNALRAMYLINQGCVYFMLTIVLAYIHHAWGFMPKSLFFMGAGILLFLAAFLIEHRRRKLVTQLKEELAG